MVLTKYVILRGNESLVWHVGRMLVFHNYGRLCRS